MSATTPATESYNYNGNTTTAQDQPGALKAAALAYARRGIPVFPVAPGEKRPLVRAWPEKATTDREQIRQWWRRWPDANVATATGRRSGLLVVDVDHPAGLKALEQERGRLPATTTTATGSGGKHYLYRYPASVALRNTAGKLAPGIDTRAEGGYVLLPPSRTTGSYGWLDKRPPAEPPAWLLEALTEAHRARSGGVGPGVLDRGIAENPVRPGRIGPGEPIPEGKRNDTLTRICGRLHDGRPLEALEAALLEVNAERAEPPLPAAEVVGIARSIFRREPCKGKKGAPDAETLATVAGVEAELERRTWRSMGEHTTRDVLIAACRIARRRGSTIPAGVRVSVSVRELALEAAVGSTRTVHKALCRAREMGLIRRDGTGRGPESAALVLLPPRAKGNTNHRGGDIGPGEDASVYPCALPTAPRLRWSAPGQKRFGKTRGRIVDLLERAGPLDLEALAAELAHKRPRDLRRRTLEPLLESGVLELVAERYRLAKNWRSALDRRRREDGELEAADRQRTRYQLQRAAFAEAWSRGEVVNAAEFARRRRNRARIRPGERPFSGTVAELEHAPAPAPELVEALRQYLALNPRQHPDAHPPEDRRMQTSWLASTLDVYRLVESKPAPADVALALLELEEVAA